MMRAQKIVLICGIFEIFLTTMINSVNAAPAAAQTNAHENINALYMQQLLGNLNTSVDPCEDFYAYACGNWAQHYDAEMYVDVPGYMDYKVNLQLLDALKAAAAKRANNASENSGGGGGGDDVLQKAWRYYESCMNVKTPALNAFLRYVQTALHFEWPIFRADWQQPWRNASEFDWLRVVGGMRAYALNGIFIMQHVNARLSNGSHYLLELHARQPSAAIAPTLLLRQKDVEGIFVNFGLTEAEAHNISVNVVALEEALNAASIAAATLQSGNNAQANVQGANNSQVNVSDAAPAAANMTRANMTAANMTRANVTSLEMNVGDLIELVPQIDWLNYLRHALGREVDLERQLLQTYSFDLPYFRQLPALLAAHTNETIAYYIMLKFMYQLSPDLPVAMSEAPKSLRCVRLLRGYMPLAANYLYEEHYYKHRRAASDAALQRMYNKLRTQFMQLVAVNTLQLNATERAYILAELDGMQLRIGNVPHAAAENLTRIVAAYYANVHMNASDFYSNHIQLIHSNVQRMQAKLLNRPRAANATSSSSQLIYEHDFETASSSSPVKIFDNVVLVPYGYLQLPLYDHRLDALLQYSLFGFILAHELMHAYDLFHIIYDQNGNFNALGLDVAQHYWTFINCSRQAELNDVASENMADVAGLRLAYETYFDAAIDSDYAATGDATMASEIAHNEIAKELTSSTNGAQIELLLGNLTRPQLFFINSVQFLCANMPRIESLDVQTLHLGHDMHDVRVRRNWANLEHFAAAFQCAADTPMNPPEKCRWW